ncbi:MAG: FKBP-type peptidyl-prolyl cis-trans isomerase [Candidatus Paceibacterota bacterium]
MENNKNMNTVLAVIICLALVGVLIFISINNKVNMTPNNNDNTNTAVDDTTSAGQVAKVGDMVAMNYTGRLENGTVFDSNVDPKFNHVQPFIFPLGAGQVISGWDTGIVGMKVGDKKTLTIAPEDAYGAAGRPPVIPPNSTLIFEVELLAIN